MTTKSRHSHHKKKPAVKLDSPARLLARLDRLPDWPYGKRVMWMIGIGFFFAFFDIVNIGLALPKIQTQMHVSMGMATWAITASLIGYIVGSLSDSIIADRFGRKIGLMLSVAFFSIGSLATAFAPTLGWIILFRFITGMGIGAEIAGVSTYMGEMAPAKCRGKVTSMAIAFGMLGFAVVPFVAVAFIPHFSWGWRVLFLIGAVAGILIAFMRRHMIETPRWLITHGFIEKAQIIIEKSEIILQSRGHNLSELESYDPHVHKPKFKTMLRKPYITRLIMFMALWFVYYIGNYAWLTLSANLFEKVGFTLAHSLWMVALTSLGFILGSAWAIRVGDLYERKWSAVVIASIWTVALLLIAWLHHPALIVFAGFIATVSIGLIIPIMYTYTAENFPTRYRATCVSITDGFGHLGGAFCGQIVFLFYYLFHGSVSAAFSTMAVTGLLTVIILCFGIKMTNKSLVHVEISDSP